MDAVRLLANADGAPHTATVARLTGLPEESVRTSWMFAGTEMPRE